MNSDQAYVDLLGHVKQTHALAQINGVLEWDQETMMPKNGAAQRSEQSAALEVALHQRRTDPKIADWLDQIDVEKLDEVGSANVRLTRQSFERSNKIPQKLSEELARTTSLGQQVWAQARAAKKFSNFAPTLEKIVELRRQEADCLADEGMSRYDALLNDYEPGMKTNILQPLLEGMRPRLSALRQKIAGSSAITPKLIGSFEGEAQLAISKLIARSIGYDFDSGRLDISVHPFSSGTGDDSRITTRIEADDPMGCLYSTIHEVGHALYEQGTPRAHALTPAGQHVSMGVHESQSRLWENQIARGRAFCQWLFPYMIEQFGDFGIENAEDLYRVINRVETGFIRTESDEVHYNLHILLRFELERELVSGELQVDDLEAEWNRRFERDFGVAVPDSAKGVLQDVHWSVGLFGYFPTYSLGNIYAGQLNVAIGEKLGDTTEMIRAGDTSPILKWLRHNIHQQGSIYKPDEVIERATGEAVSAEPLLDYLDAKYTELYNL